MLYVLSPTAPNTKVGGAGCWRSRICALYRDRMAQIYAGEFVKRLASAGVPTAEGTFSLDENSLNTYYFDSQVDASGNPKKRTDGKGVYQPTLWCKLGEQLICLHKLANTLNLANGGLRTLASGSAANDLISWLKTSEGTRAELQADFKTKFAGKKVKVVFEVVQCRAFLKANNDYAKRAFVMEWVNA